MNFSRLAQVKAAYRIVFGYPIPNVVYQRYEPVELLTLLDRAIRDMKPLHRYAQQQTFCASGESRLASLPLSKRILVRWQYMQFH